MIRRVLSIAFLAIGGWLLMGEPLIAFLDLGRDTQMLEPVLILGMLVFAAIPLAIGIALSPGDRRHELGLTILIAIGVGVVCGASAVATFMDPGFKPFMAQMPPMPDVGVAPVVGVVNLIVLTAIGWWLFRGGRDRVEAEPG